MRRLVKQSQTLRLRCRLEPLFTDTSSRFHPDGPGATQKLSINQHEAYHEIW